MDQHVDAVEHRHQLGGHGAAGAGRAGRRRPPGASTTHAAVCPPLWAISTAVTVRPSIGCAPGAMAWNAQVPRRPSGVMGNAGGDSDWASRSRPTDRPGQAREVDARILAVSGGEERQPLHVVPVQVAEDDRPVERRTTRIAVRDRRPVPASSTSVGRAPSAVTSRGTTCARRSGRSQRPVPASSRAPRGTTSRTAGAQISVRRDASTLRSRAQTTASSPLATSGSFEQRREVERGHRRDLGALGSRSDRGRARLVVDEGDLAGVVAHAEGGALHSVDLDHGGSLGDEVEARPVAALLGDDAVGSELQPGRSARPGPAWCSSDNPAKTSMSASRRAISVPCMRSPLRWRVAGPG